MHKTRTRDRFRRPGTRTKSEPRGKSINPDGPLYGNVRGSMAKRFTGTRNAGFGPPQKK